MIFRSPSCGEANIFLMIRRPPRSTHLPSHFNLSHSRPAYFSDLCVSVTFATRAMMIAPCGVSFSLCVNDGCEREHTHTPEEREAVCLRVRTTGVNLRVNIFVRVRACVCVLTPP